jgi:hypothetical protein
MSFGAREIQRGRSWESLSIKPHASGRLLEAIPSRQMTGRMPPAVPLLQPHATGLRGNLRSYAPGSAGNEARDTDIPRRLRIRARHRWNPSVTDVIVNTLAHIGVASQMIYCVQNHGRPLHETDAFHQDPERPHSDCWGVGVTP